MKVITLSICFYTISCHLLIVPQATSAWSWPWSSSRTASGQSSNLYTLRSDADTIVSVVEEDIIGFSNITPAAFEYEPLTDYLSSSMRRLRSGAGRDDSDSFNTAITNSLLHGRSQLAERGSSEGPDNSCWRVAYRQLASSCREIMANETKKVQLAVRFASCFLKASGRPGVRCSSWMSAGECTKQMSDHEHNIYLSFYLDIQDECHRMQ